jgi:hypothetical protein
MDEATWRTTANGRTWMLEHVRTTASGRKHRLFGCACVRRVREQLTPNGRVVLRRAERLAEGLPPDPSEAEAALDGLSVLGQAVLRLLGPPDGARHAATDVVRFVGADWRRELAAQCDLARCIFGDPFRPPAQQPEWARSETVRQMAQVIADEGRYADLPILADALEDAGCCDDDVLGHCRGGGPHGHGCWVLDAILGRS